jgi:hypothetical protein
MRPELNSRGPKEDLMKVRTVISAVALAGLAASASSADPSSFTGSAAPTFADAIGHAASELRGVAPIARVNTTYESIRYRPRWRRDNGYDNRSSSPMDGYIQIHGGVFDPAGDVSNGAMFGMRVGSSVDDKIQVGMQVDWSHRSDHQTAVVGNGTLPGGGTVERRRELSSVSSDLVPLMAFIQVAPTGTKQGPYVGLAGGYQALFVSAEDFATGQRFEATYDGWGWQYYGGLAIPLSRITRLTIEGFGNNGDLSREVHDPLTGIPYREIIDATGGGVRGGLSWSF